MYLGDEGLLYQWLEGEGDNPGFNQFFKGEGAVVQGAVEIHFAQLLGKHRVRPVDEGVTGRCLFTDAPSTKFIEASLGLYELNVSAFSGRDGKPDSVSAPSKGKVPISLISIAEHKLRADVFLAQTGRAYKKLPSGGTGIPTLLSSPVTTGLFGGLILNNEAQFSALSVYDLSRQKIEKGKVNYRGLEAYRQRYRMARLERIPEKTEDQINLLRLLLSACLRIGRPIHIFKGLPSYQKAFFYFDAMPSVIRQLLGYQELRLEQIPAAINRLTMAQTLASTTGLGYDVLNLYAYQRTRFQAICLAWCHAHETLKESKSKNTGAMKQLASQLYHEYHELLKRNLNMSESDGALVRLGQSATQIQRRPLGAASNNEEMLVFNICLQSALDLRGVGQIDAASMIHGIAGELETNLVRKDKMAARKHRGDQPLTVACMNFAEQFVTDVWQGVLNGKPPAQKTRRLLGSVYRMAFLQAFRNTPTAESDSPQIEEPIKAEPAQGELL